MRLTKFKRVLPPIKHNKGYIRRRYEPPAMVLSRQHEEAVEHVEVAMMERIQL